MSFKGYNAEYIDESLQETKTILQDEEKQMDYINEYQSELESQYKLEKPKRIILKAKISHEPEDKDD